MFLLIKNIWLSYVPADTISIHLMFLLIGLKEARQEFQFISIHLMFLLIGIVGKVVICHVGISIHLMFLLIMDAPLPVSVRLSISIHLMFLLILLGRCLCRVWQEISIHLMFLLIYIDGRPIAMSFQDFNTSHVSINLDTLIGYTFFGQISIHLMFLLIEDMKVFINTVLGFQYISCFY